MRGNCSTYYVHCFAHQLQLVVVVVVRKHTPISNFFSWISTLLIVVGGSEKKKYMIRDFNLEEVMKALDCGSLKTGTGLNQEKCLQRPGDTRWSSHHKSLQSLVDLFPTIVKVLRVVEKDDLRRDGWEKLLEEVYAFCDKHDIAKLEMSETYIDPKNTRRRSGITNRHHFQVETFNVVLDWLLQELDSRFNETTSQLLVFSAAFNLRDGFHNFNVESLMSLAKLYPNDFDSVELRELNHQLSLYIIDVRGNA
jgi:hypothetical protein